ncbi:hypothetical protein Tco_1419535 [Tanacetum coccineum]
MKRQELPQTMLLDLDHQILEGRHTNNRFTNWFRSVQSLVSTEKTKDLKVHSRISEGIQRKCYFFKACTLHDAIRHGSRTDLNKGFRLSAFKIGDSNKIKWEDQQGNRQSPSSNRRQEAAKVYVMAAPAKDRVYLGTYHGHRCKGTTSASVRVLLGVANVTSMVTMKGKCANKIPEMWAFATKVQSVVVGIMGTTGVIARFLNNETKETS